MDQYAIFESGSGKWVNRDILGLGPDQYYWTSNRRQALECSLDAAHDLINSYRELKWLYDRGTLKVFDAGRYMPEFD